MTTQPKPTNQPEKPIGHYIQKVADLEVIAKGLEAKLQEAQEMVEALSGKVPQEAGFSVNFYLTSPEGAKHQFTFRGALAGDWPTVWKQRAKLLETALGAGWKLDVPPAAPPLAPVQKVAEAEGPKAAANVQRAIAEAADKPLQAGEQVMRICKLAVTQGKTPDRATLAFFADAAHRYADLSVQNWPAEKAMALLGTVISTQGLTGKLEGSEDLIVVPKTYTCDFLAVWKEGQAYTTKDGKAGHYKDVVELRPVVA